MSGFNVFPSELENVLSLCPRVLECAAAGVADEKQGEAVTVFVVRKGPTLAQHCRENLTRYKIPRYIEFRDQLAKSNVEKTLRRELRAPH